MNGAAAHTDASSLEIGTACPDSTITQLAGVLNQRSTASSGRAQHHLTLETCYRSLCAAEPQANSPRIGRIRSNTLSLSMPSTINSATNEMNLTIPSSSPTSSNPTTTTPSGAATGIPQTARARAPPVSPISQTPSRYKPIKHHEPECQMKSLLPSELAEILHPNDGTERGLVLVIDIRPYTMYSFTHIESAISICIPSTLLKRQTFGFNRIIDFVSPHDVENLHRVSEATHIVFYDQFTTNCSSDSSLRRTAAKFLMADPNKAGHLYWLVGGLTAVSKDAPSLIEAGDDLMDATALDASEPPNSGGIGSVNGNSTAGDTSLQLELPPRLTLTSVKAAPRSPFSLVPVVTAENKFCYSPVSASKTTPRLSANPYLDQSSRIVTDSEIASKLDEFPKWLIDVVKLTEDGQNVLAEGFHYLQSLEKQRMYRVTTSNHKSTSSSASTNSTSSTNSEESMSSAPKSITTNSSGAKVGTASGATSCHIPASHSRTTSKNNIVLTTSSPGTRALGGSQAWRRSSPSTPYSDSNVSFNFSSVNSSPLDMSKKEYSHKQRQQVFLHQQQKLQRERERQHERVNSDEFMEEQKLGENFTLVTGDDPRKNRYTNIAPYKHNVVHVQKSRYLNGSYISSRESNLRYIATQAPTPTSFGDFWWCVWENKVPLIVMLTTLRTESGQIKGNKYWFDCIYDGLKIELRYESTLEGRGLIIRHLNLTSMFTEESRLIVHLQYLNWPDLGCPTNPSEVLELVALKRQIMSEQNAPEDSYVMVHCSAGCGRTGTFCAIDTVTDYMDRLDLRDAQKDENDRIMGVVSQFREQRIAMVQNQRQLQLCYQAVMLWFYRRLQHSLQT